MKKRCKKKALQVFYQYESRDIYKWKWEKTLIVMEREEKRKLEKSLNFVRNIGNCTKES